ncbi:MAG: TatD family hydrolase [Candidatus Omnitrophota bacterium]|jgi:TatD DNase family protein
MLIDAHLHLQDIQVKGVLTEILARAWDFGVCRFYCNSTQFSNWSEVEEIERLDDRIFPFFGVHPWYAEEVQPGWDSELEHFLRNRNAGVGEIGLDKARKDIDFARQTQIFHRQLEIAGHLAKPFSVHCVRAWGDLTNILKSNLTPRSRFVMHSYQGSPEMLREFLDLGAYVSFSWKTLQRETESMQGLVRLVPLDRLLLETDFPYTGSHQLEDDVSAMKYFECLRGVYALAALAKGIDQDTLEKAVWANGTAFLFGTLAR